MEFPIATAAVHAQLDELGLEIYPAKRQVCFPRWALGCIRSCFDLKNKQIPPLFAQAEDCEGSSPCKKQIALNAADIDSHNDMGPSRSPVRTSDDVPDFNVQVWRAIFSPSLRVQTEIFSFVRCILSWLEAFG